MAYLIALLGVTICVLFLMAFVRAYDRRLKELPGPWIMNQRHSND